MNILNKDIHKITFDDIVTFCSEKQIEGIQLEYKKEFPQKGLAKNFASLSNTRGGLIIVGIEENKETGIPKVWDGVKNEGKLIERVHQFAAQVEPLPSYEACITNEKEEKVFLLIRIFEGDRTPYYVQNDANIWVRTGNISNPIDIASSDALELLFRKKEKAEQTRLIYIERTEDIFSAALERAEKERLQKIVFEKQNFEKEQRLAGVEKVDLGQLKSSYVQNELGSNTSICTILLQPFFPKKSFITPFELKNKIPQLQAKSSWGSEFPNYSQETIPEGVLSFKWNKSTGKLFCEQIFCNGLIYNSRDILLIDENGLRKINMSFIADLFYMTLLFGRTFFGLINFIGHILGHIMIQDLSETYIHQIELRNNRVVFPDPHICLLNNYKWDIDLDTSILNNQVELFNYFVEKMNEIYVGFNFSPQNSNLYNEFLKELGWVQ